MLTHEGKLGLDDDYVCVSLPINAANVLLGRALTTLPHKMAI